MAVEDEIAAEVAALKERFPDNKALYREVCALLFFRHGITPTTNKLYQYVRRGTMGTPAEALAKFWAELRSKAHVDIDHPDIPEAFQATATETLGGLWREATAVARAELSALRLEVQAEQMSAKRAQHQAELALVDLRDTLETLRATLAQRDLVVSDVRHQLEAERREHAGTTARLDAVQDQLVQAGQQQRQQQESFSADLARAREGVTAADERAAAAERRALHEIEQERQARGKAEKQIEVLRTELSEQEARERRLMVEHGDALNGLRSRCDVAEARAEAAHQAAASFERRCETTQEQLAASRQEAVRLQSQADAVQSIIDRLTPFSSAPPTAYEPSADGTPRRSGKSKGSSKS